MCCGRNRDVVVFPPEGVGVCGVWHACAVRVGRQKPTRAVGGNHHPRRRTNLATTVSVSPQVGTATALPRRSGWTLVSNCAGSTTEFPVTEAGCT